MEQIYIKLNYYNPKNLHMSKFFRTFAPEYENILLRF